MPSIWPYPVAFSLLASKPFFPTSLLNETQKRCDKGRLLFRGSWQLCISPSFPSSKGHLHLGTIRLVNLVRTERSSSVLQWGLWSGFPLFHNPPEAVHERCVLHFSWEEVHSFHQVVLGLVTPNWLRSTIQPTHYRWRDGGLGSGGFGDDAVGRW